jgi:hypothetical protein
MIRPIRLILTHGRVFIDTVGEVAECGESVLMYLGYFGLRHGGWVPPKPLLQHTAMQSLERDL